MSENQPAPWSVKPARLRGRDFLLLSSGSVIAAFYIGTGDITIGANMGAKFGLSLWWTYFLFAIAAWALIDMSVRYFVRFGKTPMSVFKDVHPVFTVYIFLAAVVCATFGAYNQWAACGMVISGLFPAIPPEIGGAIASTLALLFLLTGAYKRIERVFVFGLVALIVCFFASALMARVPWGEAARGLWPSIPGEGWQAPFAQNAGSMINAWLILIYPYTMIERGWFSERLQGKVNILHRARIDYAWGVLAAAVVALPIMATAAAVARPFGIVPRGYMELSLLLEPLAGSASTWLFLGGLFLAAWTAGVGWWLGGTYALLDIYNLPIKLDSKPARVCLGLYFIPSTLLLLLRVNPVFQMLVFSAFLTLVFPVIGLVLLYRVTRADMGYFRWFPRNGAGSVIILLDLFAVGVSVYIGVYMAFTQLPAMFARW